MFFFQLFGFFVLILWIFFLNCFCVIFNCLVFINANQGPKPGSRRVGQNFALFFPSPSTKFVLFFLLWGSSRGILVVFEAPGRSNVHVWSSCPVWWGRRGFTRKSVSTSPASSSTPRIPSSTLLRLGPGHG